MLVSMTNKGGFYSAMTNHLKVLKRRCYKHGDRHGVQHDLLLISKDARCTFMVSQIWILSNKHHFSPYHSDTEGWLAYPLLIGE